MDDNIEQMMIIKRELGDSPESNAEQVEEDASRPMMSGGMGLASHGNGGRNQETD